MPEPDDRQLYDRAVATVLASWEAIARGSAAAEVQRLPGVTAGIFPNEPERSIYNNAVLDRGLSPGERIAAVETMQAAYTSAGIEEYAAWVHESEPDLSLELGGRGFAAVESTRVMGMSLTDLPPAPNGAAEIAVADWATYLEYLHGFGLPETLLSNVDPEAFHVLAARSDGEVVATALAFDHAGDCGIFNTSTYEHARRRGLATALTAQHLREAAKRGCETATLQSTPMAERVYGSVGFHDLGRFLEFAPGLVVLKAFFGQGRRVEDFV
jgi:GNAT superfamily N-acetyltransferase